MDILVGIRSAICDKYSGGATSYESRCQWHQSGLGIRHEVLLLEYRLSEQKMSVYGEIQFAHHMLMYNEEGCWHG